MGGFLGVLSYLALFQSLAPPDTFPPILRFVNSSGVPLATMGGCERSTGISVTDSLVLYLTSRVV